MMWFIICYTPKGVFFMSKSNFSARDLAIAAGLTAFSAVVQLVHIGYQSPQFGMWIDIVAVTWIMAYLLFGLRMAFTVSMAGAVIITLFAPDTWLGASMKWVASFPMWFILGIWAVILKKNLSHYNKITSLVLPIVVALALRLAVVIPLNYYYAIPIWTGMSTSQAMAAIPWSVIAIFNVVQGVAEVFIAWILVNKFRLNRFSNRNKTNEKGD